MDGQVVWPAWDIVDSFMHALSGYSIGQNPLSGMFAKLRISPAHSVLSYARTFIIRQGNLNWRREST